MHGCVSRKPHAVRAVRHQRVVLGGGQSSGRSYGRGREERRDRQTKKCLNSKICLAVQRAGTAVSPGPLGSCHPSSASQSLPAPSPFPLCNFFCLPVPLFLSSIVLCSLSPLSLFSISVSVILPLLLLPLSPLFPAPCASFSLSLSVLQAIAVFSISISLCGSASLSFPP